LLKTKRIPVSDVPNCEGSVKSEYGPFDYSASIVIFSLLTALLVLAGAEWSARKPVVKTPAVDQAPPSISA
jgi:hypothetical protein